MDCRLPFTQQHFRAGKTAIKPYTAGQLVVCGTVINRWMVSTLSYPDIIVGQGQYQGIVQIGKGIGPGLAIQLTARLDIYVIALVLSTEPKWEK